jgi:hypothetical protein
MGGSGGNGGSGGAGDGGRDAGDAGHDAAIDAGDAGGRIDAGDAGACGGPCPTAKPVCVSGHCEECGVDDDCTQAGQGRCEPNLHACVQCLGDGDCMDASKPRCDTARNQCVPCLANDDCPDDAPVCTDDQCGACAGDTPCMGRTDREHCDTTTSSGTHGQCVQCLSSADCPTPAAPECASRHCGACTGDTACTGRTGTEVCELASTSTLAGQCVQCTAGKRTACSNDANACKVSDDTCTSTPYQTLLPCAACVTDDECVSGAKCVKQVFDSTHTFGPYCFYDQAQKLACADGTHPELRPYSNPVATESIDGASSTYCLPPSTTTCAGIIDATAQGASGGKACGTSDGCGEPSVNDGFCNSGNQCTYGCTTNADCPGSGFTTCPSSGTKVCQ